MDGDFARAFRERTIKPEFLSPLADRLPKSSTVPLLKDIFGHHIGERRKLTYYGDQSRVRGILCVAIERALNIKSRR
jgi:hypothetical protein